MCEEKICNHYYDNCNESCLYHEKNSPYCKCTSEIATLVIKQEKICQFRIERSYFLEEMEEFGEIYED